MKNLLIITLVLITISCQKSNTFNSEKWKKAGCENIITDIRLEMAKDLIDNKKLIGKHKTKIDSLLGKSSDMILQTVEPNVLELYTIKEGYSNDVDLEKINNIGEKKVNKIFDYTINSDEPPLFIILDSSIVDSVALKILNETSIDEYWNDITPEKTIYLKVGYNWEKVCTTLELFEK